MTKQVGKLVLAVFAVCSIAFLIVHGCQNQTTVKPVITIEWPAAYSALMDQMPIGVSNWNGVFRSSYKELSSGNGRIRCAMYSLEDASHQCHGFAVCIISTKDEKELSVLVGTSLPVHEEETKGTDYTVSTAKDSDEGWIKFSVRKK